MKCLLRVIPVALALGVLSTSPALATDKTDQSSVPAELRVAAGYKRVLQTVGRGVQIYDCANGAWKFREPKYRASEIAEGLTEAASTDVS